MTYIFDGYQLAQKKISELQSQMRALAGTGKQLKISAILFTQDKGSALYTNLKADAAKKIGIEYQVYPFSITDGVEKIQDRIKKLNTDPTVTGIIIQKPTRKTWIEANNFPEDNPLLLRKVFKQWWELLVSQINPAKDVDGLHPDLENRKIYPATMSAVLSILESYLGENYQEQLKDKKIIILGKSDLLGQPLYVYFKELNFDVEMIGSQELKQRVENGKKLLDADLIVSATGRNKLITGDLVKEGVMIIDAGEPNADVDFASVKEKAQFITPVPGGVGPMTVASLMENCIKLNMI